YIATDNGSTGGLAIIDVSTPSAPALLGSVSGPSRPRGVKVAGSHAYVVGQDKLVVFDISDPTHPTQQAYRYIYNSAASLFSVDVAGTLAYVIGHTDND